jgi:pre-mRNA-splicing factor SYF1
VALFPYPFVYDIWIFYLTKFVKRYGGKKLERARDLYEQALENVPKQFAKYLFVMYAELEEKYGLARYDYHHLNKSNEHQACNEHL